MVESTSSSIPILNNRNSASTVNFQMIDYAILGILLLISSLIGIYFGFFSKTKQTTDEYLMGGRTMRTVPIAISLIASQISALVLITIPADAYAFGSHYMLMSSMMIFAVTIVLNYAILPVFFVNNIDNCYAYLELRFDKSLRDLITALFFLLMMLVVPINCFAPSLAFSQVTGQNIHLVNSIVTAICVVYTMMGGIKAVVWTDVLQAAVMVVAVSAILIVGVIRVGGVDEVISRGLEGGRITGPIWTLDLSTRQTVWNLSFGIFTIYAGYIGLNQSCMQRIVSLPSLDHARRAMWLFCIGLIVFTSTNCIIGIVMYAFYKDCDPIRSKVLHKIDQLIPYFVNEIVGHIDGMSGLFVTSIFCASLSTVSASLNAISGVIYKDYICRINGFQKTESRARFIMNLCVALMGIYCVGIGFVIERSSSLFQLKLTVAGLTQGAVVGAFTVGFFCPKANHKGVFYAVLVSMITVGLIICSGQMYRNANGISYEMLPTSVDGCTSMNISLVPDGIKKSTHGDLPRTLMHEVNTMSYLWYTPIGLLIVWVVGIALSYVIGPHDKDVNINLCSPWVHGWVSKKSRHMQMYPVNECTNIDRTTYVVK